MAVRIYTVIKDNGTPLWPEARPMEWIESRRKSMPRGLFYAQYMNDPSGVIGVRYDIKWLQYWTLADLPPMHRLVGIQAGDPATSEDLTANYFGHCTAAKDPITKLIYILGFDFAHIPATKHTGFMREQYKIWTDKGLNIQKVRIETGGPQQATVQRMIEDNRQSNDVLLPIETFKPVSSKEDRLDSLIPHYSTGTILFKGQRNGGEIILDESKGFSRFRQEFTSFPRSGNDDLLDAMYMCIDGLIDAVMPAGLEVERDSTPTRIEFEDEDDRINYQTIAETDEIRERILGRPGIFRNTRHSRVFHRGF